MSTLKQWIESNSTLVYFLAAQLFAGLTAGVAVVTYTVRMENRVHTMETRGAPFTVGRMDNLEERITILEQKSNKNTESITRIVDVLTKELGKNPSGR
jgi:hypothetical protein